ncbi:ABC transporter substrate-binding protein [Celeribacter litoreus]|uniref:ABC transporter substrate-binding protein n=1 Tax=Celeribacter litoreus TaxID=2876714 RepID=UPI001CC9AE4C|nr:ABC transporter substrate-binding protein [Celeribacter litoreus]MCA0043717.1 ABC transporter substrate-binding protein [Celeribacter litoreus]
MNTCKLLLTSAMALIATQASAQTVDVQQYWTSASESKAMNVIADAYKAQGGTWIDSPSADYDSTIAAATSRIVGGEAPSAVLMTPNGAMLDLADAGLLRSLNELRDAEGWTETLAPLILDRVTVDGDMVALPLGVHADNWIWYNTAIFEEVGIEEPTSIDELFAAADAIKAAGYTAFAVGGEPWQEVYILTDMILSLGGPDYWNKIMVERSDEALQDPLLVEAFELFRKVADYTDAGSPGRSWNATTNMVITGEAGMQFMGDWAKGEFLAAGQTPGEEFGCFIMPSETPAYAAVTDVFVFPETGEDEQVAGQDLLALTVMDPEIEVKVAAVKGSVPARTDVDLSGLDMCAAKGAQALGTPGVAVASTYDALPGDLNGQLIDMATQFWTDPDMTAEEGAAALRDVLAD